MGQVFQLIKEHFSMLSQLTCLCVLFVMNGTKTEAQSGALSGETLMEQGLESYNFSKILL